MARLRVLVTGGAGFIGSHLVDALLSRSHQILVIDDLSSGHRKNLPKGVRLLVRDIRSAAALKAVRTFRPDVVFHLAAQKNVRTSFADPALDADVNVVATLRLIEASRSARLKKFVFASTGGMMYAKARKFPVSEAHPASPESPYGIGKHAIELYLATYAQTFNVPSISLRLGNIFGPRQDPAGEAGVIAIFGQAVVRGRPIFIHGTGRQTRDYVYVSDAVDALLRAMRPKAQGLVNIGTGHETSVRELAQLVMKATGRTVPLKVRPAPLGEVQRSSLSSRSARQVLGWKPKVSVPKGIAMTMAWGQNVWR